MKTYTIEGKDVVPGLSVSLVTIKNDVKFPAVTLGGGQYSSPLYVSVGNPPAQKDGKFEKLLHAKLGETISKKPKLIGTASDGDETVIVRLITDGGYTKMKFGNWEAIAGDPKFIVGTSAQTCSSPRLGAYTDSLITMKPGDVIKARFSNGITVLAIFFKDGQPAVSRFEEWEAGQVAAEVASISTSGNDVLFGMMPAYTFYRNGLTKGIETKVLAAGNGLVLGPREGGWRAVSRITVAASKELPLNPEYVAIVEFDKKFVFVSSAKVELGKYLVRVDTAGLRKGGRTGAVALRGNPKMITEGWMEIGTQNIQHHRDQLWVMTDGDALRVGQIGQEIYTSDHVISARNGKVTSEPLHDWAMREVRRDLPVFLDEGRCQIDQVPNEWLGQVVSIHLLEETRRDGSYLRDLYVVGEVISTKPLVLNLGWNEQDRIEREITYGTWVHLEKDKKVKRLEGAELEKRTEIRTKLGEFIAKAKLAMKKSYYDLAEESLRKEIREVSDSFYMDLEILPTEGGYGRSLADYLKKAEAIMSRFEAVVPELQAREASGKSGEILPDYKVSLGGSKNGRAKETIWAIMSDGSIISPKNDDFSEARFGDLPATVLVISWLVDNYGYRYSESWRVKYLPKEVTEAQKAKVAELEKSCHKYFVGGKTGWDLTQEEVYFQTAYDRDFQEGDEKEAMKEMASSIWAETPSPIDLAIWKVMKSNVSGKRTVWPERRTVGDPNRPSEVMGSAYKKAAANHKDD